MARLSPEIEAAIQSAAASRGLDPNLLRTFVLIESGGDPNNRTGSYRGLLQLSPQEFARNGGRGDIFDVTANLDAGAMKIKNEAADFEKRYGRQPTATELYMMHQQGPGGAAAHMANPDAPAWQNMYSTGEGQQKGAGWAKQAIWGNVPDDVKAKYGSVDNITSRDFMNLWDQKVARYGGGTAPTTQVASADDPNQSPNAASLAGMPQAAPGSSETAIQGSAGGSGSALKSPSGALPMLADALGLKLPGADLGSFATASVGGAPAIGGGAGLNIGPFSIGGIGGGMPGGSGGSGASDEKSDSAPSPTQLEFVRKPLDMQRLMAVLNNRSRLGLA